MKYLEEADIDRIVDGLHTAARSGVAAPDTATEDVRRVLRDRKTTRHHAGPTARAFNRALQKNGGSFTSIGAARDATRLELEADWNSAAQVLRWLLKLVSVLYPQSKLFIVIFDALFMYWLSKNTATIITVTH